ncbi:MAG: HAMP domain-containing histidine kinase [Candidatus Kapabacteria bacterium]|jgi:signal transduction histidine kinase|nr:HAMP domain-containing histidine kinase [Candidatus Kapabacteria bacterium]
MPHQQHKHYYSAATLLSLLLFAAIVLVTLAHIVITTWQQSKASREFLRAQAFSIGQLTAAGSANGVIFRERDLLERAAYGAETLSGFQWLIIRDISGDTLYTKNFDAAPETFRQGASVMPFDSIRILPQPTGEVLVLAPVRGPVETDRRGEVLIMLKTNEIIEMSNRTRTGIISSGIAASVVLLFFGFFAVRRMAKTTQKHVEVANKATQGDLTQRVSENFSLLTPKETVVIRRSFNRMLDSLEQHQEEMRIKNERLQELSNGLLQSNIQMEIYTKELEIKNKQIEQQNSELQMLNVEKNEFLGIVAHDLKNPIAAFQGLAAVLLETSESPEMVQQIGTTMLQSADKMLELVKNLLDVNQIERGGRKYDIQPVNTAWMLMPIVESYMPRAEEKNICLHFSPSEEAFICFADSLAFSQIMDNIVSNAVKYSPLGKNVWLDIERVPDALRISVRDEGPGFSEEDKRLLFGKFARLSAQPTGGEHSTGLGLSIVKKMVEAMNGKVWCESELGKGATFFVEFPSVPPATVI